MKTIFYHFWDVIIAFFGIRLAFLGDIASWESGISFSIFSLFAIARVILLVNQIIEKREDIRHKRLKNDNEQFDLDERKKPGKTTG